MHKDLISSVFHPENRKAALTCLTVGGFGTALLYLLDFSSFSIRKPNVPTV